MPSCNGSGLVAHHELDNRDPGRDVDRSQLPHRPDTLEPADVERIQAHDVAWPVGVLAEPERAPKAASVS